MTVLFFIIVCTAQPICLRFEFDHHKHVIVQFLFHTHGDGAVFRELVDLTWLPPLAVPCPHH